MDTRQKFIFEQTASVLRTVDKFFFGRIALRKGTECNKGNRRCLHAGKWQFLPNGYPKPFKRGKYLCFFFDTLLHVTRTLWKYFHMVTPPPSHWKIRKIDPPSLPSGKSDPFRGGCMDIFWNHTIDQKPLQGLQYCLTQLVKLTYYLLTSFIIQFYYKVPCSWDESASIHTYLPMRWKLKLNITYRKTSCQNALWYTCILLYQPNFRIPGHFFALYYITE